MRIKVLMICLVSGSCFSYSQNNISVSIPFIYSSVQVKNNWNPPTSLNYTEIVRGTSLGLGLAAKYSFRPTFIVKEEPLWVNIGIGYFQQHFEIERPFDYSSQLQPIFYTSHYYYECSQAVAGLSYQFKIGSNYLLICDLSYSRLRSFRQVYKPKAYYEIPSQINRHQIHFGSIVSLSIGLSKDFGQQFSVAINLLSPVYTRWRNDQIFKDDSTTFSHPKFSLGLSISVAYKLVCKQQ